MQLHTAVLCPQLFLPVFEHVARPNLTAWNMNGERTLSIRALALIQTQDHIEDVFRCKQEAKSALAKAQTTRDTRSRKPVVDMSLPWAGKF